MSVPPSVVFLDAIIIVMHDEIIRVIHYTARQTERVSGTLQDGG